MENNYLHMRGSAFAVLPIFYLGPIGSIAPSGSWPKVEPMGRRFLWQLQYMLSPTPRGYHIL